MDENPPLLASLPHIATSFSQNLQWSQKQPDAGGKPQKSRPSIMQKLNEKYADKLHDNNLVCARRLAALHAKAAPLQFVDNAVLSRASTMITSPGGTNKTVAVRDLAGQSMAAVEILNILRKRRQKKKALAAPGPAIYISEGFSTPSMLTPKVRGHPPRMRRRSVSPQRGSNTNTLHVPLPPQRDFNTNTLHVPPPPGSHRPPPLQQLAFQDLRRAAEISELLEEEGSVGVSRAFDPKPWRIKSTRAKAIQCAHGSVEAPAESQQDLEEQALSALVTGIFAAVVESNDERAPARDGEGAQQHVDAATSTPSTSTATKSLQRESIPPAGNQKRIPSSKKAVGPASALPAQKSLARVSMPSSRGSKRGGKPTQLTPILPLLRVTGPVAPFHPGQDVPPEQWSQRESRKASALMHRNPARFQKVAATQVLSEQQEVAERAAVALEYVQAVPMDKCADQVLRSSIQEMGFRRPFLQVPLLSSVKMLPPPIHLPVVRAPPATEDEVQTTFADSAQIEQAAQDSNDPVAPAAAAAAAAAAPVAPAAAADPFPPEEGEGVRIVSRLVDWQYNIESSIFALRRFHSDAKALHDTPAVMDMQLSVDWQLLLARDSFRRFVAIEDLSVKSGEIRLDKALNSIRSVLSQHMLTLRSVFSYYATMSLDLSAARVVPHSGMEIGALSYLGLSFDLWQCLLDDMMVVTSEHSQHCSAYNCAAAFDMSIEHVYETSACYGGAVSQKLLLRFEMFEALIRIAALKYVRLGPFNNLAEAVQCLIETNILKASLPPEALHNPGTFRSDRLYQQQTDWALRNQLPLLQVMFEQASELLDTENAQSQRCLSLQAWLVLLRACRMVDRHVSERDAAIIFTWSCMVVASEGRHPQKAFKLRWPDFLEAISRLADLLCPPPLDELEVLLREVLLIPAEKLAEAMAFKPWHVFYCRLPPEKVATFRRSSAKLCAEKSQPVGDKIKAMLEHLGPVLMEEIEEEIVEVIRDGTTTSLETPLILADPEVLNNGDVGEELA